MKVLLYMTTHFSALHSTYLINCLNTTIRHPALASADILIFAPLDKIATLKKMYPNVMYNSPPKNKQTKQLGAIDAIENNYSRKYFNITTGLCDCNQMS